MDNVTATLNFINNGKFASIILNYDEQSENLFKWYQQLVAESLGKKSKGFMRFSQDMYIAEDDIWKVFNFCNQ